MPVRYEILPHRAVHVRMTGAIAPAEVVDFLHDLARDPALEPAMPHFGDMRGVTQPATGADLERIASALERAAWAWLGVEPPG